MIACQGLYLLTLFFDFLSKKCMKNSFLLAETRQIYKSIEQQIEKGPMETDEGKWIERAFALTMKTWLEI